jgi:hypothetical protein
LEDLDRDIPPQGRVVRQEHGPHPTLADWALESILAEVCAGL